jgi:hypothetical protein
MEGGKLGPQIITDVAQHVLQNVGGAVHSLDYQRPFELVGPEKK